MITQHQLTTLLRSKDVKEISSQDPIIQTYYVSDIIPSDGSTFTFSDSSIKDIPLCGWSPGIEEILKEKYKYVEKAYLEINTFETYPPVLMFEEVKHHNIVKSPIIYFRNTSDDDRKIIEDRAKSTEGIPIETWAQDIEVNDKISVKPIKWVNNKQKGIDFMDNFDID